MSWITILVLKDGNYTKTVFTGNGAISSQTFSQLKLTATEILEAEFIRQERIL